MDNNQQRIFDKIKACLAMASDKSSPEEAAIAMRQAQALMRKHGISLNDIDRASIGTVSFQAFSVSRVKNWEMHLVGMVARVFGCRVFWTAGKSGVRFGRFGFVGVKSQLELAEYTAQVLQRRLYRARAEYVASLGAKARGVKSTAGDNFCIGWVSAVQKTVIDMVVPEDTKSLIDDVYEELTGGRNAKVTARQRLIQHMYNGFAEGKKESLHRPMETGPEILKIQG